jgi:hypothetical protein
MTYTPPTASWGNVSRVGSRLPTYCEKGPSDGRAYEPSVNAASGSAESNDHAYTSSRSDGAAHDDTDPTAFKDKRSLAETLRTEEPSMAMMGIGLGATVMFTDDVADAPKKFVAVTVNVNTADDANSVDNTNSWVGGEETYPDAGILDITAAPAACAFKAVTPQEKADASRVTFLQLPTP